MKYELMLKNKSLLDIEIENKVIYTDLKGNKDLLPFGMRDTDTFSVEEWLNNRKVPKNRQFVNEIMAAAGNSRYSFLNVSYGLSLNDAYWVKPVWLDKSWEDVNLYHNPFDKVLSDIAFTGYAHKIKRLATSPEYTTSGMQKKAWSNREDGIYLIKGRGMAGLQNMDYSSPDGRSEVFSEYYASQIADVMGIPHVKYDIEEFHHTDGRKELVSVCKLFTSEEKGYVPFSAFYEKFDKKSTEETFKILESMMGKEALEDIMVFDAIIFNQDRHLGNFGMLFDNNTKKMTEPAPVFDNGASLFCGLTPKGIENMDDPSYGPKNMGNVWNMTFDEMAELFLQPRHHKFLRKMTTFQFKRHPRFNIKEESLVNIERYLQKRVRFLLNLKNRVDLSLNNDGKHKRNITGRV